VRRYLDRFGPATLDDIQWWTGFSKRDTTKALQPLTPLLEEVAIEGLGDGFLMLRENAKQLDGFAPHDTPSVFLLPSLDPYVMGYRDRRRFLSGEHHNKVFDRSGNALPTVWVNGRVVGAWDQREEDGSVICGFFETVGEDEQAILALEAQRLKDFLGDTFIKPAFFHTAFTRHLRKHGR
jgi:hypothetical protein